MEKLARGHDLIYYLNVSELTSTAFFFLTEKVVHRRKLIFGKLYLTLRFNVILDSTGNIFFTHRKAKNPFYSETNVVRA